MRRIVGWICVLGLWGVFLLRVGPQISTQSQTVDEPYHVGSAVALWEAKAHVLGVQHPPLPRLVAGVALMAMGAELPEYRGTTMSRKEDAAFEAGSKVLCGGGGEGEGGREAGNRVRYFRLLAGARWAMTVFPLVAMAYAYLLGVRFGGVVAGVLAGALVSFDPTLLGHGFYVCTDGAAEAAFLAVLYHAWGFVERGTRGRAVALGLAVGLGLACKFSVVLAIPAIVVVYVVARMRHGVRRARVSRWVLAGCVAFVALWATYFFRIGTLGDSDTLSTAPQWGRVPEWVKNTPVPMPSLWLGLGRLAAHSAQGHGTELFGRVSSRGWWYYFPVLMVTKTPVALLLMMVYGSGRALLARREHRDRERGAGLVVLWPAVFLLLVSMAGSIQIGIRHVAPTLGCLCVLGGIWAARSPRRAATLMVILLAESWPLGGEYIGYYEPLTGALRERIAVGSNFDWGQDLAKLTDPTLKLDAIYPIGERQGALFATLGLDPAVLDAPVVASLATSVAPLREASTDSSREGLLNAPPRPGARVAVSLTRRLLGPGDFAFLQGARRIGRVGDGFDLYELGARR